MNGDALLEAALRDLRRAIAALQEGAKEAPPDEGEYHMRLKELAAAGDFAAGLLLDLTQGGGPLRNQGSRRR
jgi:hypothetical protein